MENNNLSGEKKPEMITLKNGNKIKLENVVCAEVKVSAEFAEKLNKISERLKNIPIIKASN
jgi:hypothetical protein